MVKALIPVKVFTPKSLLASNYTETNLTDTAEEDREVIKNFINQQPFIEQASSEFVIYASEKKEIVIGEIKDDGSTFTLESMKISCAIPNEWIKLPETTDNIKDIRLIVNVPSDVQDDTCEVQVMLVQLKDSAQQ